MFKVISYSFVRYGCDNVVINPNCTYAAIQGKRYGYDVFEIYSNYSSLYNQKVVLMIKGKLGGFINNEEIEFYRPNNYYLENFPYLTKYRYDVFIFNVRTESEIKKFKIFASFLILICCFYY